MILIKESDYNKHTCEECKSILKVEIGDWICILPGGPHKDVYGYICPVCKAYNVPIWNANCSK